MMQATVEITDDAYFTALLVPTRVSVLSLSFLWGIGRRKDLRQAQRARARRDNRLTAIALSKQFDILQLIGITGIRIFGFCNFESCSFESAIKNKNVEILIVANTRAARAWAF